MAHSSKGLIGRFENKFQRAMWTRSKRRTP
jgi:hypothetical protein